MKFPSNLEGALFWHRFGLGAIPLVPESKTTAIKWNGWLKGLSAEKIRAHWSKHPEHEVGHICDERILMLDADTPESAARLHEIENVFDVKPALIVGTKKGLHHYFKRAKGTFAHMDSHSSEKNPARIDIRTGKGNGNGMSMAVLPPSTGKAIILLEAESIDELSEVGQDFIDAIWRHNGRKPPRAISMPKVPTAKPEPTDDDASFVQGLLDHIPSDGSHSDWFRGLAAVKHTLGDTPEAFTIADAWSSTASNYCGNEQLQYQWNAIRADVANPVTLGTLVKMARDNGANIDEIRNGCGEQFEVLDTPTVTIYPSKGLTASLAKHPDNAVEIESIESDASNLASQHALSKYSITGKSAEYEKLLQDQQFVMPGIALVGQWTVQYAGPNTGKTLLTLHQLAEAIRNHGVNAGDIFYINADDNYAGLTEKLKIAENLGFHVLAPGHQGFKAKDLVPTLHDMATANSTHNTIVVLDTIKKFTDVMDKRQQTKFGETLRMFVSRGGTVIGLAHVNKNPDKDGNAIYAGTSDILDDADCAYVLQILEESAGRRIVEYRNIKNRGNVLQRKVFSYSLEENMDYAELLASVHSLDNAEADKYRVSKISTASKTVAIEVVESCINDGYDIKMKLVDEVSARANVSKAKARDTIERFTGDDPGVHHWNFKVVERGAKQFYLLQKPENLDSCEPDD